MSEDWNGGGTGLVALSDRPISLLIAAGPEGDPLHDPMPLGASWSEPVLDHGMTASIEAGSDHLEVRLCLRVDDFDADDWTAFSTIPGVISVLVTPLIAWFVIDIGGLRCRAPCAPHHRPGLALDIQRLLCSEGSRRASRYSG